MKEYSIQPQELKELLKKPEDFTLIDVRSMQEHNMYNIGGTVIPLTELTQHLNEFDKNKLIIIYCHSGVRSLMAVKILLDAGFKTAKSLEGGIVAWQREEEFAP